MSDQLFEPGDRVEIVVSTGFGSVIGRFLSNDDQWLRLDQSSAYAIGQPARRPIKLVAMTHIVTITKTEEQ